MDPWDDEPNEVHFDAEGLKCVILRHPNTLGLCGYVGIPPDHPWFGQPLNALVLPPPEWATEKRHPNSYGVMDLFLHSMRDDPNDKRVPIRLVLHVHGGLTYADDHYPLAEPDGLFWFGFDCGHAGDFCPGIPKLEDVSGEIGDKLRELYKKLEDAGVPVPKGVYRDVGYVTAECQSLAAQLQRIKCHNFTSTTP